MHEKAFLNAIDSFDLFYKFFNHSNTPTILTEPDGRIVISNASFLKLVQDEPSVLHLPGKWVAQGKGVTSLSSFSETDVTVGKHSFHIKQIPFQVKSGDTKWMILFETRAPLSSPGSRFLLDNGFEIIFQTTENDELVFTNKPFSLGFGFDSDSNSSESIGKKLFGSEEIYRRIKAMVLSRGAVTHETILFKRSDGTLLTCLVNCKVTDGPGPQRILNWAVLDISDRVEFENRLRQKNEQLAKVNQQMEKFLYSTSHDLRSPLTTILGLVNLLRMETKDGVVLDYATKIESSAIKLDKIVRDIMTFSRTTYQRVRSERIDFEAMIWKVLNAYQSEPALRRIHLEVKVQGESQFYTDPERVEGILDNVLRNAIQFFDSNKSRPFIQVNVAITDERARVDVMDNGIGIAKQHLGNIFNMFYKASYNARGAGLGLFVVKEALSQLNGTIEVEAEVGFGSRFRISIPNDQKGKLINRKIHLQQSSTLKTSRT